MPKIKKVVEYRQLISFFYNFISEIQHLIYLLNSLQLAILPFRWWETLLKWQKSEYLIE
jgi:hypothetical protein